MWLKKRGNMYVCSYMVLIRRYYFIIWDYTKEREAQKMKKRRARPMRENYHFLGKATKNLRWKHIKVKTECELGFKKCMYTVEPIYIWFLLFFGNFFKREHKEARKHYLSLYLFTAHWKKKRRSSWVFHNVRNLRKRKDTRRMFFRCYEDYGGRTYGNVIVITTRKQKYFLSLYYTGMLGAKKRTSACSTKKNVFSTHMNMNKKKAQYKKNEEIQRRKRKFILKLFLSTTIQVN